MLYEFQQVNATGNGSYITCYIVQNPRIEQGMNVAEIVGVFTGEVDGEFQYEACTPRKFVFGGNFTMIEFTRELIAGTSKTR